ncbi:MAG: heme biosynthesis protein HemY [Methylococcaceae bacterium]|nr:heme biosynthesis protein HemY [Methylococcaceae bacterium]MCI0733863.1 heme biosynthesis protein HemY [Methylococcaceae bacterium]
MKYLIYLLAALFIAVAAAFYLHQFLFASDNPGHVLIGYGSWSLETSLYFAGFVILVAFIAFYILLRLIGIVIGLPRRMKRKGPAARRGGDVSYQSLVAGLIDSAEGNWESAEKSLIRHAANSGAPLIHYLTAAKAAQFRGAVAKRDEYLRLAHQSTPGAELTVGLTEAQLQLSDQQFDKALESLTALRSVAPTHATVLRLLHDTYRHLDDWSAIRKLLPDLSKNRVLMEAEIKLLETETYSELLKKAATSKDRESITRLWNEVPAHIKSVPGMLAVYYAAMIDAGAGVDIEEALRKDLEKDWNETLLVLYGCIQSDNPKRQLAKAEVWVSKHPGDAILMRMLGKLSMRANNREKAEMYLRSSVELEPSVDGFLFLGDLFSEKGEKDRALESFRKGLLFASDEVVKQIDYLPVEPAG